MTKKKTEDLGLPHSHEAERSVLGAIIAHNPGLDEVAAIVTPEDFYRDAHRRIFRALLKQSERREAIDFVTLMEALRKAGDLDEVGGAAYVSALTDGVPRSTNLGHYARIVKDKAILRGLIAAANTMLTAAYEAMDEPSAILTAADRAITDLVRTDRQPLASMPSRAHAIFATIEARSAKQGQLLGRSTGFPSLDALTNGLQAGHLVIIAARTSIGKTTLALNIGAHVARAGGRVAVFSFEMSAEQLEFRILSQLSRVPLSRIQAGAIGAIDGQAIGEVFNALPDLDITIDERADQDVGALRASCRWLAAEKPLDLVVIDYVQMIPGALKQQRGITRNEEVSDIARRLKAMARELRVPILLCSQLRRTEGKPQISDLRESGVLEQAADTIILLHRKNHAESGVTEAIVAKQRDGPTGTEYLTLDRHTVTFTDGGTPEKEPSAPPKARKPRKFGQTGYLQHVSDD